MKKNTSGFKNSILKWIKGGKTAEEDFDPVILIHPLMISSPVFASLGTLSPVSALVFMPDSKSRDKIVKWLKAKTGDAHLQLIVE